MTSCQSNTSLEAATFQVEVSQTSASAVSSSPSPAEHMVPSSSQPLLLYSNAITSPSGVVSSGSNHFARDCGAHSPICASRTPSPQFANSWVYFAIEYRPLVQRAWQCCLFILPVGLWVSVRPSQQCDNSVASFPISTVSPLKAEVFAWELSNHPNQCQVVYVLEGL